MSSGHPSTSQRRDHDERRDGPTAAQILAGATIPIRIDVLDIELRLPTVATIKKSRNTKWGVQITTTIAGTVVADSRPFNAVVKELPGRPVGDDRR